MNAPAAMTAGIHLPQAGPAASGEALHRAAVLAELKAGKPVDEIEKTVLMEEYKNWGSYDRWRALNVRGMARFLTESGAVTQ